MAGFIGNRPTGTSLSGSDISDDSIESADIKAGTIVNSDINASAAIATSKVSGAVTSIASHGLGSLATLSSVDTAQLTADAVDGTKIADDSLNSEHYVDGSIDLAHLAADCVDGTKIADDSINSEHIVDGSVDDAHLATGISASKLTGALPAISGASLTNLPASGKTITESTSDPVVTTNPSDGVGALFMNKNSGNLWCCTDSTSNENVWTNIGNGSNDIQPVSQAQGTVAGYTMGGYLTNTIHKFTFASLGNSTDLGDVNASRYSGAGCSSSTDTFQAGGYSPVLDIARHNFSSGGNSSDHGDLNVGAYVCMGFSATSEGFVTGGVYNQNTIQKFAYSSNTSGTDLGNLGTGTRMSPNGCSSTTDGHTVGGETSSTNKIQKFSFSNSNDSSDFGTITNSIRANGSNSRTHGYAAGGSTSVDDIEKFSFSSGGSASAWGSLPVNVANAGSCSSGTHGYTMGGYTGSHMKDIYQYPFATDSGGSDVGDLSSPYNTSGQASDVTGGQH